jgi:putative oxidoreductase
MRRISDRVTPAHVGHILVSVTRAGASIPLQSQRGLTRRPYGKNSNLHPPMEGREMDWKRLVQFALLGGGDLEQYAILLVRVSIGLFFAISGGNKLFTAGGTKPVYDTLVKAKVPFPKQTAYFVATVEFVCGSLVTVGLLSSAACVALSIDMIVAILTNTLSTLPKGLSALNWIDDVLYFPEVLYVLFFIWLIFSGAGKFSVDYWLAGKLLS